MGRIPEQLSREIGDPPGYFSDSQRTAWDDVVRVCPDLAPSDVIFIELVAVTLSRYRHCREAGDLARQAVKNLLRPMFKDCLIRGADAERLLAASTRCMS